MLPIGLDITARCPYMLFLPFSSNNCASSSSRNISIFANYTVFNIPYFFSFSKCSLSLCIQGKYKQANSSLYGF